MPIIQDSNQALDSYEYYLKPGFLYLTREETVIYTVLGSCVAVCLWDRQNRIGAMNHFLYPRTADPAQATTRYGNVAVLTLIRLMLADGGGRKSLEGQIFGGGAQGTKHPEEDSLHRWFPYLLWTNQDSQFSRRNSMARPAFVSTNSISPPGRRGPM